MPDWKYAFAGAIGLLGIAAFILFVVHPGGFEGQINYFFGLFPGVYLVLVAGWANALPRGAVVYWLFVIGGSFIWYFILSFAAIRGYRVVARFLRRA